MQYNKFTGKIDDSDLMFDHPPDYPPEQMAHDAAVLIGDFLDSTTHHLTTDERLTLSKAEALLDWISNGGDE